MYAYPGLVIYVFSMNLSPYANALSRLLVLWRRVTWYWFMRSSRERMSHSGRTMSLAGSSGVPPTDGALLEVTLQDVTSRKRITAQNWA